MSGFVDWLEKRSEDSKLRAVLRRSLGFVPGKFPTAYPYVEPFLKSDKSDKNRKIYYLVAGLWASHWQPDRPMAKVTIARACAELDASKSVNADSPTSTEKRFIGVLDADRDQLPYRLRQLVALLKDYPIDFAALLQDLLNWNKKQKKTQCRWAQDFYRGRGAGKQEDY